MTVLEVKDIHKSYQHTRALKGISFKVPKGSIFGILGPNGSGKTTLLGILLDVLIADRGTFSWYGAGQSAKLRSRIGTLLETPNFYHYLSAVQNLEITRQISGRGIKNDIAQVLRKVGLYHRKDSPFSSFSLGMKQRLAIAAALLGNPSIIVLDEPTNGLDPEGIVEIRSLILELRDHGHTVIVASHLLDEVERICTHVAIMKSGDLLACGAVSEILSQEDIVEIGIESLEDVIPHLSTLPGFIAYTPVSSTLMELTFNRDTADLKQINTFFFQKNIVLSHLLLKRQRLESRFFELIQN